MFLLCLFFSLWINGAAASEKVKSQLDKAPQVRYCTGGRRSQRSVSGSVSKALKKGYMIQGAAGTSVGALNGASDLWADDFKRCGENLGKYPLFPGYDVDDKKNEALREWNLKTVQP